MAKPFRYARAKQGSLSTAVNWMWTFLLTFFTLFISARLITGIDVFVGTVPCLFCLLWRQTDVLTTCNLMGAVMVYLFLYDSSDILLEDVDMVRVLS